MSASSVLRRLFLITLSGAIVVALSASPAEAKKKKKAKKKSDTEVSAASEAGSKSKKKKKTKASKEEAAVETSKTKKERKEIPEDDAPAPKAAAPAKAAAKAAPVAAPAAAAPAVQPAPAVAEALPPPPIPPADDAETAISRSAGLGRLKLQHVNEVTTSFRLYKLAYDLNNHPIFPEVGKPDADLTKKTIPIWEGVLPIGENEIKVTAVYKGVGSFIFAYLNDMTFVKTDTTKVKVVEGATTTLSVLGQEDTSPFTATEDRPHFDYRAETSTAKSAFIR